MSELVRQKRSAALAARRILSGAENDLIANGVREGTDRARRIRRASARVDTYRAEIVSKARLEERTGRRIERFTGTQMIEKVVRDGCIRVIPGRFDTAVHPFLFFRGALRAGRATARAWAARALHRRRRHPHDFLGHAIRFLFKRIGGLADAQLRLNGPCAKKSLDAAIADRALQPVHRVEIASSCLQ
jgi:hypothetical protein